MKRTIWTGIRATLVLTVILGVVYPLVMTGIAQVIFPHQANGSPVTASDGTIVGSSLIGQSFSDATGNPLPQYFQPRPSAAGAGYNASSSGGSNQGPESPDLIAAIAQRRTEIASFNGVLESEVPPDAVTASASGLDPDISPAYAAIQVNRVATQRDLPIDKVRSLVQQYTQGRELGYIGDSCVNVVELNLALDELAH
ncbi:MAG: potassium-transporting ATPase subunit KdpC [Propionibacteriaceae bacterium]|nr:potassium-transporting ATPase subunit KdpC [Propionibacteriaceae bacterium]